MLSAALPQGPSATAAALRDGLAAPAPIRSATSRRPLSKQPCIRGFSGGSTPRSAQLACACQSMPQPALTLQPPLALLPQNSVSFEVPGGAEVTLCGVFHMDEDQHHAAEHIWRTRPAAVVVETAVNEQHGAQTGRALTAAGSHQPSDDLRLRMFRQIAAKLDTSQPPDSSQLWQDVKRQFPGEQLAYIAAFAVGATLVFGDRPKHDTYARLHNQTSLAELDAAFGAVAAFNHRELLSEHGQVPQPQWVADHCVYDIMTRERDVILLHSLQHAALAAGASACIIGIVGEGHMEGMQQLLQQGSWPDAAELEAFGDPGAAPQESDADAGLRRALLSSTLGLCCDGQVVADFERWMGRLPLEQLEANEIAQYIYGSTRMLLATLPTPEDLAQVCGGCGCDMWEVLAPLRAVRPINGGPGWHRRLAEELSMLHLEILPEE